MFFKIAFLKNFAIFTWKHLCWSLFFKERPQQRCFSVNIAKFVRTPFFTEHIRCYFWINCFEVSTRTPLHKEWSFPLKISPVNVKSLMENFIFCAMMWLFWYKYLFEVSRCIAITFKPKLLFCYWIFTCLWMPFLTVEHTFKIINKSSSLMFSMIHRLLFSKLTINNNNKENRKRQMVCFGGFTVEYQYT